jgi:hypothetical protein
VYIEKLVVKIEKNVFWIAKIANVVGDALSIIIDFRNVLHLFSEIQI